MNSKAEQVLGDQFGKRFITDYQEFRDEPFMFSVHPLYKSAKQQVKWRGVGAHEYAKHDGPLMLDSGAFQTIRTGEHIAFKDTINLYRQAKLERGDYCIQLDLPIRIDQCAPRERLEKVAESGEIYRQMRDLAPELPLLFVVHGWTEKELKVSLDFARREQFIALGSYLAMLTLPANLAMLTIKGVDQGSMWDAIIQRFLTFDDLFRRDPDFEGTRVHVLGASSAHSSHLMWYMGFEQTDSAAWRKKAAFGKIAFEGLSEISVSKRKSTYGAMAWRDKHDELLKACECPICGGLSLAERKEILQKWRARAVHNAFIYLQERDRARELVGTPRYFRYLEKRYKRAGRWKKLLRKVKGARSQTTIDQYLKMLGGGKL